MTQFSKKNFIVNYQKHNLMLNLALNVTQKKDEKLELLSTLNKETLRSNKNF